MLQRNREQRGKGFWSTLTVWLMLAALTLSGCASWLEPFIPTRMETPPVPATETPTAAAPGEPTATPEPVEPIPGVISLTLWVPPQFNPESDTPAGTLFKARLDAFMEANPGVLINVRVKAASGPGGLLDALTASTAAAPRAVPSIVALNRPDLEQAALKSLILPLDGVSTMVESADWYEYARQSGRIQNSTFGLPFAGDALILVYRPAVIEPASTESWEGIFASNRVVIAPLADSQALLTLALYRSAGGQIQDEQSRPVLQAEVLAPVLQNYRDGIGLGSFPGWLTQLQTDGQAWQAFTENQGDLVVTWGSNFLADLPPDASIAPLPSMGSDPFTLASGWSWALTDNNPLTRDTSVRLMEFLSESEFLAGWTAATGYLPTRPTVLAGWENQSLAPVLTDIILSAEVRPPNEIITSLGPNVREAVLAVFNGSATPEQAAEAAAANVGTP
jgi:maltose-binding protein MalE